MIHDWQKTRQLLIAGSVPAIEAFFTVHPLSELRAISYTWEWGQAQAAFYPVANTAFKTPHCVGFLRYFNILNFQFISYKKM